MTAYKKTKKKNWSVAYRTLVDSNWEALDCSSMVLTTRSRELVVYYQALILMILYLYK